jgi:hypothetical protein
LLPVDAGGSVWACDSALKVNKPRPKERRVIAVVEAMVGCLFGSVLININAFARYKSIKNALKIKPQIGRFEKTKP